MSHFLLNFNNLRLLKLNCDETEFGGDETEFGGETTSQRSLRDLVGRRAPELGFSLS